MFRVYDKLALIAGLWLVWLTVGPVSAQSNSSESVLTLDLTNVTRKISPTLYGLMIEDINHSIDGGLYGELIQNRAFNDDPATPAHWTFDGAGEPGSIELDAGAPVTGTALTKAIRIKITAAQSTKGIGAASDGYWGIPVRPRTRYRVSFYAKADASIPLSVAIESRNGSVVYARSDIGAAATSWKAYTATLTTGVAAETTDARFVVRGHTPGTLWLSQVSLFGPTWNDRPNGARPDLMQLMKEMNQSFLRLPGGNFLEGNRISERFDFKTTLGKISQRPGHPNPWGYRSSDGFGLLEYLEWCEDLHLEPVLAVFAGYALRGEHVAAGPKLQPFVQDALDEIEYLTGGPKTPWGAVRAKDGHPAPFKLTYVEIGNEDWFDRSGSYDGRFAQFFDAIKAAYPHLQIIATAPVKSRKPDVLDEHFYRKAEQMAADSGHYDKYDRSGPKIFVGEWASQDIDQPWVAPNTKGPTPSLNSALGDAAWMTGMERNSDIVVMASYAPLLVNVNAGARQWAVNLIGFDGLYAFGSPSYYALKMFAQYLGDVVVPTEVSGADKLYTCASRDTKSGTIYLKVVNMSNVARPIDVKINGAQRIAGGAFTVTLAGSDPSAVNTINAPKRVAPVRSALHLSGTGIKHTLPPNSVTVLVLPSR